MFDQHEEDGFTYYNVAHMLRYNGEDYIARLVAREDKNGNLFYDHEFTEIKKIGAPASGREDNTVTSPHQSTAKILENIIAEKLFEEKNNPNQQNSQTHKPTDQTNPQQSTNGVFRPLHPAPLFSTQLHHTRMLRPLLPQQQGTKKYRPHGKHGPI